MKKASFVNNIFSTTFPFRAIAPIIFFLTACDDPKATSESATPFCISDTMMKQIELDTVSIQPVETEIHLSGKITFDESKIIKVYPLVGGNIFDVKVELGDYVEKGQVLASIRSSDIATHEKDLEVANSNLIIAKKNMEVAEEMFKNGYGTEREYITAQKEYQKVQSELNRIQEVLTLFGKSDKKSNYNVRAPLSGFVVDKNINTDMQIRADYTESLFTISDLKHVWVMANVYESDIAKIKAGYEVKVSTLPYPDKIFTGKINKIFNVLDPVERVMKVQIKLDNPDYMLKPEMYAAIIAKYKEENKKVVIPSKAIIYDHNKNYVMVYKGACDIETRELIIHKACKHKTYIDHGVAPGERIISRSQLYIYDALND